jgi:hypothetical protein
VGVKKLEQLIMGISQVEISGFGGCQEEVCLPSFSFSMDSVSNFSSPRWLYFLLQKILPARTGVIQSLSIYTIFFITQSISYFFHMRIYKSTDEVYKWDVNGCHNHP